MRLRIRLSSASLHALWLWLAAITCNAVTAQELRSLHYKPFDHVMGDVHPYYRDGECFLYYLKPSPYDSSLVHCRDLINWTTATLVHRHEPQDAWMRPYYVLGVLRDDAANAYRSFYGYREGQIVSSVSDDLIHWSCGPREINIPASDYYQRRRDPYVFWIDDSSSYGCVMTTWMKDMPQHTGGAISLATSKDLRTWVDHGPIVYPKDIGEPECPQMFKLGDRWYLLASIYDRAVGGPVYWTSDSPTGNWSAQPQALEGKDLCASQVAFNGSNLMLFGWVPLEPSQPGNQSWGGHLALPREVISQPDGKLGIKLAKSIHDTLERLPTNNLDDINDLSPNALTALDGAWDNVSMRFDWHIRNASDALTINSQPLGNVEIDAKQVRILDASNKLWSEQKIDLGANSTVAVQLVIEDNIVEVFIDNKFSLVARLPSAQGPLKLAFTTRSGTRKLTSIRVTHW